MTNVGFKLSITIDSVPRRLILLEDVSPDLTVAELISKLLSSLDLPPEKEAWCLTYQDSILHLESRLGLCLPPTQELVALVLIQRTAALARRGAGRSDTSLEEEFELACEAPADLEADDVVVLDEAEDAELYEADEEPARQSTKPSKAVTRRATVRYYRRMNPERVYPLLVLITKDMIEKVQKKDTDERSSSPFKVEIDSPVEIEPVMPGCDCHPPKLVARLSGGELTATFRVLPRVLGKVDGASVTIRQDHNLLAEIPLDVKVVQRFWVFVSGLLTFLLPALSAILKHFGLDFETQKDQGFNLYVGAARLVFDQMSPLTLTTSLGFLTGVVWWFTRPQTRDVFWDIKKVGPAEKLERIATAMEADAQAGLQELAELLIAFPDYQPARLFFADWHYDSQDHRAALKEYTQAFKLGVVKARHYQRASFAASKLGENETALRILQEAERTLNAGDMTPVMLYNMGCYHARLGDPNNAMAYLMRAVAAGYTKAESYHKDPDLTPLRNRPDFKRLLAQDLTVHFACPKCDKKLWAKAKLARKKAKCSECSAVLRIPAIG